MTYLKNPVAKEVKEEILGKVKAGEKVAALAKQYGVSDRISFVIPAQVPAATKTLVSRLLGLSRAGWQQSTLISLRTPVRLNPE